MNNQKRQDGGLWDKIITLFAGEISFTVKAIVIWTIASKDYHVFDAIMELIKSLF